jgi:hypothetical protein
MIKILGDTDTKDEILESFKLINRGAEIGRVADMELVMNDDDLNYFKTTAPPVNDGYDYVKWTEDIFSR